MKRLLLFSALVAASVLNVYAYHFTAVAPSGQTLYYKIVDGRNVAVTTQTSSSPYYSTVPVGALVIPDSVRYAGNTYLVTSIGKNAFHGCSGLISVTIPNSVTSIDKNAFMGCSGLTSLTIPNSVVTIGNNAFNGCNGLTSISIPNSVDSIDVGAFGNCSGLTSVSIGNSVTSIGDGAFQNCGNLDTLIIPNSVRSMGNATFYNCTGLTSVTISNSVTSIGNSTFYNCGAITSITISNSVTSINDGAFQGCIGLPSIVIPNSVTSLGERAFYGCSGLTSVTIGNSVASIGRCAFGSCSRIASITVDAGNTHYDSRNNCNAIIATASNTLVVGCRNTIIPNTVTGIGISSFDRCTGLNTITIPISVTSIDGSAFSNCSGLTSIIIPDSVTSIGMNAFYGCSGLTTVTIGNSVISIGSFSFEYCTRLTSITIGNSVDTIGESAFYGCSRVAEITCRAVTPPRWGINAFLQVHTATPVYIPCGSRSAYTASQWSFFSRLYEDLGFTLDVRSCDTTLGSVSITRQPTCSDPTARIIATANSRCSFDHWSDGDTTNPRLLTVTQDTVITAYFVRNYLVYDTASVGCLIYRITSVTAPRTVEVAGYYACIPQVLTIPPTVNIGDNSYVVRGIGFYAFKDCNTLVSVTIPNTVTSIANCAFWTCANLTSVTIGDSVTSIGSGAFCYCGHLTSVTIPNSVTSIGSSAFNYCTGLTSVVIPNSITLISDGTFAGCRSLTSVTIGSAVDSISDRAFLNCPRLAEITCLARTAPSLASHVFDDVPSTIPVYIPCGSMPSYVSRWEYFSNFVVTNTNLYTLTAQSANDAMGTVAVTAQPTCSTPAVVTATAYNGYRFDHWSDGSTSNPYTFSVTCDTTIIAYFVSDGSTDGVEEITDENLRIYTHDGRIVIVGAETENVQVFDMMGRPLHTDNHPLPTGIYMVKVGTLPARKVVVIR